MEAAGTYVLSAGKALARLKASSSPAASRLSSSNVKVVQAPLENEIGTVSLATDPIRARPDE